MSHQDVYDLFSVSASAGAGAGAGKEVTPEPAGAKQKPVPPKREKPTLPSSATLDEAVSHLKTNLDNGLSCPCCGQYARRYKRSLYRGYVHWLIWLIQEIGVGKGWADVRSTPPHLARNGDYAKLQWWGFVESQGKRSRMWRPTQEGLAFVKGSLRAPKYAFVYDNVVEGYSTESVSVMEALNDRGFDYERDVVAPTEGFAEAQLIGVCLDLLPSSNVQFFPRDEEE